MLNASSQSLSTTICISKQPLNTLLRFRGFLWIFIRSSLSVWELEYFLSVENIEISICAQAWQSLLLLTQGNSYNHLRLLNKYLMFLEELNELFWENWSKFLTSGYLVFWKQFLAAGYLDTSYSFYSTCPKSQDRGAFYLNGEAIWGDLWLRVLTGRDSTNHK